MDGGSSSSLRRRPIIDHTYVRRTCASGNNESMENANFSSKHILRGTSINQFAATKFRYLLFSVAGNLGCLTQYNIYAKAFAAADRCSTTRWPFKFADAHRLLWIQVTFKCVRFAQPSLLSLSSAPTGLCAYAPQNFARILMAKFRKENNICFGRVEPLLLEFNSKW